MFQNILTLIIHFLKKDIYEIYISNKNKNSKELELEIKITAIISKFTRNFFLVMTLN